ncbi:MAG: T9SS type A sorting domain-containing protein, partial [Flexibacteraceae bacterium]
AFVNGQSSPLSEPFLITSSSKKSINAPKLNLYPNPTTGIVTLTTSVDAESIIITNEVGQLVYNSKAQPEMELILSHLAKGVYMVQVQSNKGVTTQRLVIQ